MSNFKTRLERMSQEKSRGFATFSKEEILGEVLRRERSNNVFPLHVFHEKIRPYLGALNKHYDLPASYIGLTLLSAYSTAIGTAYKVDTGNHDFIYLPVWACLCGISSSGGSVIMDKIYGPLNRIQKSFDSDWADKTRDVGREKLNQMKIDTIIFRDSHIPTLVKYVLPDNPKGVCKYCDELLEWINGMNQLSKKEGTDEQFWLSAWNCSNYSGIRSGKEKFVVQRPFTNVIGKAQYAIMARLFSKDRDTTGFVFRMLFAIPEVDKMSQRDSNISIPEEWIDLHNQSLIRLFKDLPVHNADDDSKHCVLEPGAKKVLDTWTSEKITVINKMEGNDQNIQAGILGKIKEYAFRFAAILHLADKSFDPLYGHDFHTSFKQKESISSETMIRALELADYFYKSACEAYELVQKSLNAPTDVLVTSFMLKRGKSYTDIGEMLYGSRESKHKTKAARQVKTWINEYPRVFGAYAK